jgi:hypothetical protein
MSGSPGLFSSIHAFILGSLLGRRYLSLVRRRAEYSGNVPFVLFSDVIFFAEIDEVSDRFSGEQLEAIDDIDLLTGRQELTESPTRKRFRHPPVV